MEAALRGDETPSRMDSLSLGTPLPPVPRGPRPPVPQHSSPSNPTSSPQLNNGGKHSSPRTRPPPPIGRVESREKEIGVPPLPTRVGPPSNSKLAAESVAPPLPANRSTSPGHAARDGPPLPSRGSLRSAGGRPQPPPSTRGTGRASSHGGSVSDRQDARSPPLAAGGVPPRTSSMSVPGGKGTSSPAPLNRPGGKPPPPGRPGKPTLPSKPQIGRKPVGGGGGAAGGKSRPVVVPSPSNMTPREMMDFFINESSGIIANVQDGVGNIPTLLENLVNLGEAIADQARGKSVQFRIQMSKFRSELGSLKTYANVSWYNSTNQIVGEINQLVTGLKVLYENLLD